jgi:hypothetical protein
MCGNKEAVLISGLPNARMQATSQKNLILGVQKMYQLRRLAVEYYFLPKT